MTTEHAARNFDFSRKLLLGLACVTAGVLPAVFGLMHASQVHAQAASPAQAVSPAAPADLAGNWQGTLHAGQDLRLVLKITKAPDGSYKAVFYSIDQGGGQLNVNSVTLQGAAVKMAISVIGGSYEGTLSADGKTIDGNWKQGPSPLPLALERSNPDTAWAIPEPPKPMAADADPSFEVATIKPNISGGNTMQGLTIRGRNFATRNSSLGDLISFSYSVQKKQIVSAPDWLDKDRYDISAVPEQQGVPNSDQIRVMIRKLLKERFGLTFHHEKRDMSAYVLTVGKNGNKLTPNTSNGNLPGLGFRPAPGGITMGAVNATMSDFTGLLQILVLDRPVVDQTGITGKYDFQCTFAPDDSQFNGHPPIPPAQPDATAAAAPSAPSLYEAIQAQMGLKLDAEKTAVDVIVIDHIEKPSAN